MSATCATAAARCFTECAVALEISLPEDAHLIACWSPGRIEVLGKHTDYCGGESILAAVERGFAMLAAARDDNTIRLLNVRSGESCEFPLDASIEPPLGHWSNYPQTVARRIARNFPASARHGATIAFASNLPPSAGMSSSSAFVVGTFLLISQINQLPRDQAYQSSIRSADELAGYLGSVENGGGFGALAGDRGVGTFGGSEDHVAILRSHPDALVRYSFCPVQFKDIVDLDDQFTFAVASSGVAAEKTGSALAKYNRVSKLATAIVDLWRAATHCGSTTLAAILRDSSDAVEKLIRILGSSTHPEFSSSELLERLEHFRIESRLLVLLARPRHATESPVDSEWNLAVHLNNVIDETCVAELGKNARKSQQAGIQLLHNQVPETIRLAELADELCAYGASAFGAGFGGSVWALIDIKNSERFLNDWAARYRREFPEPATRAEFFATRPSVPALVYAES